MYDPFIQPESVEAAVQAPPRAVDVGLTLDWTSRDARHRECLFLPWLEPGRDHWPGGLGTALDALEAGVMHEASREAAAALVPPREEGRVVDLPATAFNCSLLKHRRVEAHAGRFYPRAFIAGHAGIEAGDRELFRVGALEGEALTADLNHPLAGYDLQLQARVVAQHDHGRDDGQTVDVARLLTARGPGMQACWRGRPTDFWVGGALEREDPNPDAVFYAEPRLVHHLDATARDQIAGLYAACIPPGARVLDLMGSWESHLDRVQTPAEVVGLGMNAQELAANPVLTAAQVQDLNTHPELPYAFGSFDAVVCTASVEYLMCPEAVFRSIRQVLRPGGVFVVTCSDRCFPTKAVAVWERLYDFERMGLVLDLFLQAGFSDLATFSLRGLPRPADDPYAGRLEHADPVFAVWGCRGE